MKYIVFILFICASCNTPPPADKDKRSHEIADSVLNRVKIIEFAGNMAVEKMKQGYTRQQADIYEDSILLAHGIDTAH